jgi:hypothetical protein
MILGPARERGGKDEGSATTFQSVLQFHVILGTHRLLLKGDVENDDPRPGLTNYSN